MQAHAVALTYQIATFLDTSYTFLDTSDRSTLTKDSNVPEVNYLPTIPCRTSWLEGSLPCSRAYLNHIATGR